MTTDDPKAEIGVSKSRASEPKPDALGARRSFGRFRRRRHCAGRVDRLLDDTSHSHEGNILAREARADSAASFGRCTSVLEPHRGRGAGLSRRCHHPGADP